MAAHSDVCSENVETMALPELRLVGGASASVIAEAYAFRKLVAHLQDRPEVHNIEIMNLAGFCRNCLSKWYCECARLFVFFGPQLAGLAADLPLLQVRA